MEVVGAAASVSQLAVYIQSAARCLRHLYKSSKAAALSVRSQLEDINVLIKILDRINRHHAPLDAEILPILISVADTAQTLTNWFDQAGTFCHSWILFLRKADIEEAFGLLHQKCNLLVLYYSERNNRTLNRIESSLNTPYRDAIGRSDIMGSPESEKSGAKEDAVQHESFNNKALIPSNGTSITHDEFAGARANTSGGQQTSTPDETKLLSQFFPPRTNSSLPRMQPDQPQEKRQEEGQSTRTIVVSNNRVFRAKTELFNTTHRNNTYRPKCNFEGRFVDNDVYEEHVKVGNEES